MSLAVVIVPSPKRRETTFPICLDSVREQNPDEIVVVSDFPCEAKGVRSFVVPSVSHTTCDALAKRDVGWLATRSRSVLFLCDDHTLAPGFVDTFRTVQEEWAMCEWDILVPARYVMRGEEQIWLNVGEKEGYAGGHAAIFKRICGYLQPWSTTEHHPNWDVIHSLQLKAKGARLAYAGHDLAVVDIEGKTPWL